VSTISVGASVKTVSSSRICSENATSEGFVAGVTPTLICGIGIVGDVGPGIVWANAGAKAAITTKIAARPARSQGRLRRVMTS
jgi:hypothetical protein